MGRIKGRGARLWCGIRRRQLVALNGFIECDRFRQRGDIQFFLQNANAVPVLLEGGADGRSGLTAS